MVMGSIYFLSFVSSGGIKINSKIFPKDVGKGLATLQNDADTLQGFADQVRSEMPQVNAISVAPSGYTTVQSENDGKTHRSHIQGGAKASVLESSYSMQ